MKNKDYFQKLNKLFFIKHILIGFLLGLFFSTPLFSQMPTAGEIADSMKIGWNLGNNLETVWEEPAIVNQDLINAVSDAGFNTIRIPCAWDKYANQSTLEIDTTWLARVKETIDYCYAKDMYVLLNCHWDGGWLENNVTPEMKDTVNIKQEAYWTQIANYFKDYDEHLLFASANEPNVENSSQMAVLLSYHQTFIDAVRATGGNNSDRVLIIQGPSTDIDKTNNLMNTLPIDSVENRLIVEIHFYTPYNFCLMESNQWFGNMFYFWGQGYHSETNTDYNPTWGEEDAIESLFKKMKIKFIDKGIPVIMGEWGVIKRISLTGEDLDLHIASREYYYKYVSNSAIRHGIVPIYWDNGWDGNNGFALFNRTTGSVVDQGALDALMEGSVVSISIDDAQETESTSRVEFITASPNPVSSSSKIQLYLKSAARVNISIVNILGQEVAVFRDLNFNQGKNSITWNAGHLPTGTYIIKVQNGENILTKKILVTH